MIKNIKIIEDNVDKGIVGIGSNVKVKDIEFDEIMEYKIVGAAEADPFKGKISNQSPLGFSLLGKTVGDIIVIESPNNEVIKYEILEV